MEISVVIPTYNRRESLARTLETLFAQDFPRDRYEVLVAVDGSSDGTAEFLARLKPDCSLRVVDHRRNLGQAAARNSAIKMARGDLVLFIDDDLLCDRALLREHAQGHRHGPSLVVSGPVLIASESPSTLALDRLEKVAQTYPVRVHGEHSWRECNGAANISISHRLLLASGGWDERLFRASEDVDLILRLHKLGARFYYQPGAVVRQVYIKSARQLVDDAAWAGRNLVLLSRKQPDCRINSALAAINRGGWLKRSMRRWCARLPVSPEPLLELPFLLLERLRTNRPLRELGIDLLELRMAIAAYRGAMRQAGSWEALRRQFGIRLPVLLYHHVGPRPTRAHPELTVSPARFERQVGWLAARGYTGINATDWLGWLREGKALPPKPILLTFDDGYADLADYAFPVLRRYGFSAVVYIITGKIGGAVTWDEPPGADFYQLMTAEQIRHWAASGIEFGAHSRTHPNLTMLDPAQCKEEVLGSRDDLERITGTPPASFAYPFGYVDDTAINWVGSGFALAMSCNEGVNDLTTDPLQLKRTMVQPTDSLADLALRTALGWSPLLSVRGFLRVRTRLKKTIEAAQRISGTRQAQI